MFELPDKQFIDRVRPELVDYWGRNYSSHIVADKGKNWLLKSQPNSLWKARRDRLAYLMAGTWLNIPEIRLLTEEEVRELDSLFPALSPKQNDAWLIRLAQDYSIDDLPNKDLTESIAGELFFSLWIRRRDAHFSNRALVSGVPMFFDFEVGFLGEPRNSDLGHFLRGGPDSGYVGNWRFLNLGGKQLNLGEIRAMENRKPLSIQPINDSAIFDRATAYFTDKIKHLPQASWIENINQAGFVDEEARQIDQLLLESQANIDTGVAQIMSILNKPHPE